MRLSSRSNDFEVFGDDTGCAATGVVVLGVEVFQVAAERGLGRFAKPGECFQSRAVMNPIELDRFRNRERKFELRYATRHLQVPHIGAEPLTNGRLIAPLQRTRHVRRAVRRAWRWSETPRR